MKGTIKVYRKIFTLNAYAALTIIAKKFRNSYRSLESFIKISTNP